MKIPSRLFVVSNRLPFTVRRSGSQLSVEKSCGGLVTALEPLLQRAGGCWIGSLGAECDPEIVQLLKSTCKNPFELRPVSIKEKEYQDFYNGCSNEIIWPLFHDIASECRFEPRYWETYRQVTENFADAIESAATPRDFVWVHDYHLMLVAGALRERNSRLKLAYFHHIPFPAPDIFGKLPWRVELLSSLLEFNQLGFQTKRDRQNFVASLRRWLPGGVRVRRLDSNWLVSANGRCCVVGNFPISVDFEGFSDLASTAEVIYECDRWEHRLPSQSIVLGVDRLDYTKGILERLTAFRTFLEQNPGRCGSTTLVQLVIPSREDIPSYQSLRRSIEQSVSEINGRFGRLGWTPVVYMYRSVAQQELVSLYRSASVALVTPLRDGMNLVAKEFCASRPDHAGVLILSEFAGAADELSCGAFLINPNDTQQVADTLRTALEIPKEEVSRRMSGMREVIRKHDIWDWCTRFCGTSLRRQSRGNQYAAIQTALRTAFVASAGSGNTHLVDDIDLARTWS